MAMESLDHESSGYRWYWDYKHEHCKFTLAERLYNMSWIDWSIVIGSMIFLTFTALTTKKHTKSVADFLAANRCAGRYLLGIAQGEAAIGAISVIALFEVFYQVGFVRDFWGGLSAPLGMFIALSGWVIYRFRKTRAMTIAQFFEVRYSRKFRIFAGILGAGAGILNFGLFPAIGARFFINFCGITTYVTHIGPLNIDITLATVMLILLGIGLFFTFTGGQIAILVTDFWQGLFASLIFAATVAFLWFKFPWSQISEALIIASTPGKSLLDPFDMGGQEDFNIFFFAITWFFALYSCMAWQGTQAFNCSAITAHEAKMSRIVGGIRYKTISLGLLLIPLAALTYMNHPDFTDGANMVRAELQRAFPNNEVLQKQMVVPVAMTHFIPKWLLGGFTAAMLGFFISNCNTYMHSWGSMIVQDVICPLRKKPLATKQHLRYLVLSITGVAVFAFFFSLLFPLKDYIWMFLSLTGAIYLGGAGSVIIGGLYWKRGTTAAAWAAMIAGVTLSVLSIVLKTFWEYVPFLVEWKPKFPFNGQVMAFWCSIIAIVAYITVSLFGKRSEANMDMILYRGKYAIEEENKELEAHADHRKIGRFWKMIGVNSHEFSKVDKGLFLYTVIWACWQIGGLFVLIVLHMCGLMSNSRWLLWWRIQIYTILTVACVGVTWINIGGLFDLRKMYKRLTSLKRDDIDDGRVE